MGLYGKRSRLGSKDEPDRAISDFDHAIQLDPKLAIAYGIVESRSVQGRELKPRQTLTVLALDPDLKNELQTLIQTARAYLGSRR